MTRPLDDLVGIPWLLDGRGVEGCDCVGLNAIASREIFGTDTHDIENLCSIRDPLQVLETIRRHADDIPTEKREPGDYLVFTVAGLLHTAIFITPYTVLLMQRDGKSRICRYGDGFKKRTVKIYRMRGDRQCRQQP